jgi:hypothetical protein
MWWLILLILILIIVGAYYLTPGKPKPCPCSKNNIGEV